MCGTRQGKRSLVVYEMAIIYRLLALHIVISIHSIAGNQDFIRYQAAESYVYILFEFSLRDAICVDLGMYSLESLAAAGL
jgi:hypothetical protein